MSTPDLDTRVRASFELQRVMATLGARMTHVAPGEVDIELPFRDDLTQQDGFIHAGIVTTVVDSACGYAAYTLMPEGARVLSVELKVNLLAPAEGDSILARGRVFRAGRTLTVCQGEGIARGSFGERSVALMQATMMCLLPGR